MKLRNDKHLEHSLPLPKISPEIGIKIGKICMILPSNQCGRRPQKKFSARFFHHRQKFGKIGRKTASFYSILPHTPFIFLDYRGYWNFPIFRDKNRAVLAVCPNSGQNPDFRDKGRLCSNAPPPRQIDSSDSSSSSVDEPEAKKPRCGIVKEI